MLAESSKLIMKRFSLIIIVLSLITLVLSACGGKGPLPPADKTPPTVILTSPTNGAQNVAINSSITITFSEAMDASTINEQTITLSTGTGNVSGSVTYSDTTAVFKPASSLNLGTLYTVTIGGVKDVAGNAMVTPVGFIFFTETALVPTTILLSSPGVMYNANDIVTITVSSGGGIPIGNVSLSVDGGTAVVLGLTGGSTTFTIPSPSAGTHTLYAAYAEQGAFGASSASGILIVNQAATTTTITAPAVTYGTDGSVTVTVSSASGTPTGNVSLSVDGGAVTTQALVGGSTTFTIPSPSTGTHTLNAAYAAQGNYGASSASGTLGVGVRATTMTLSAPNVTYGANGIVTVTVSSAAGTPTGNVSLSVDGGAATTQALAGGSTAFTIPIPSAGTHTLSATYAAQGTFGTSSASSTLIVNQAATTTTITAPAVTYGTDGSVTVTVTSTAGTPTGNVSLRVDGGAAMTQALAGGTVTFTVTSPSFGSHALIATYVAQGNFGASSASGTLGVGPGATAMSLSAPGITYGANGIVTVTVSSAAGSPTGNVSLSVGGGAATTQGLIAGSTTFTIPIPSAGTHTLSATYAAQGTFGTSSASGTLIVNQAATTTTITAPAVTFGADGSVTVTVTSTAGTPTGNVSLSVDGGAATTQALAGGSATFTITSPSFGSHALIATYVAQGNFGASFASGTLGVGPGATAMSLSAPGVTYGANGIVTVTVSSAAGTPTGNVSLSVDGGAATTQGLIAGSTTFTIPSPSAGSYTLNAVYAAQGTFGTSSASGTLIVNQAATTTTITAPALTFGADGSVTVTVTSTAGTPTGNVSLSVDNGAATTQALAGGSTTFTISSPSAGTHNLNAAYTAQGNFGASSASGTLTVSQASTSTSITSSLNPSNFGDSVAFTAAVTPSIATGTVTFKDDTTVIGTGTLSGGVATFSTSTLTGGVHSLTAEYGGDTNFAASTSSVLSQTVNYTITTSTSGPGTISPSGTVPVNSGADQTFTITPDGGFSIVDVVVDNVSQGPVASYPFTNVTANHTIIATFQ